MIDRMIRRAASPKIAILFGLLYFTNQGILLAIISRLGLDCLKIQLTFSSRVFASILNRWTEADINVYLNHFYFDSYHPFLYAISLASTIAVLTNRDKREVRPLAILFFLMPFVAGLFDLLENILHILMINHRDLISPALVAVSGTFSFGKWLLVSASIIFIIRSMFKRGDGMDANLLGQR
jgi:hypothetical protein